MDILPLVVGATTFKAAKARVSEALGVPEDQAWQAIGHAVIAGGWAILTAPALWVALRAWWACRRLDDDLEHLREVRDTVKAATLSPRALAVVEVKTGKALKLPDGAQYVGEIKVGPDVLAVRATALAKVQAEITRAEAELARGERRFQQAADNWRASLEEVGEMQPIQLASLLLRRAVTEGDLSLATACLTLISGPRDRATADGGAVMANLSALPAVRAAALQHGVPLPDMDGP